MAEGQLLLRNLPSCLMPMTFRSLHCSWRHQWIPLVKTCAHLVGGELLLHYIILILLKEQLCNKLKQSLCKTWPAFIELPHLLVQSCFSLSLMGFAKLLLITLHSSPTEMGL